MIKTDYSLVKDLFLVYPKNFGSPYENLTNFYLTLYKLIPDEIRLFIIVNNETSGEELKAQFPKKKIEIILIEDFDEIWLRDIMGFNTGRNRIYKPIFKPDYCQYIYTESYLEKLNNQVYEIFEKSIRAEVIEMPLVIDGGNFVTNGEIAFITDKIFKQNPEINGYVSEILYGYLGVKAIYLKTNSHDLLGHTDGYLNFLNKKQICVSSYPNIEFLAGDQYYIKGIQEVVKNQNLKEIPFFDRPIAEKVIGGGETENDKSSLCLGSARGIYVNFLILNDTIILPEYTIPNYKKAIEYNTININNLQSLGYKVKSINCDDLGRLGGSLRCINFTN